MHVALLNYAYDSDLADAETLLARYTSLTDWAEALLAAGARQVTVVQRCWCDAELERNGVRYLLRRDRAGPTPRLWQRTAPIHAAVAGLGADVVHAHGLLFAAQIGRLRRRLPRQTALVLQDHAGTPGEARGLARIKARLRRPIERAGLRATDAFLFTDALQAQPWRAAGLIGPDQPVYAVLESSRRLERLPRAEARAQTGLRGDPLLLWVGRLNANKDPLTVLAGFERALERLPNARLAMSYLTDDLLPEVRAMLAGAPALAERVDLLGRLPYAQMAALFSAADLFVLGSHREGSGYALIEAIGCGAAPVVTDIPSFRAITDGGRLGRLWPPGDAAALACALAELGAQDRAPLRAALAQHFEQELSWPAVGRRALAVYQNVLSRRRAAHTEVR